MPLNVCSFCRQLELAEQCLAAEAQATKDLEQQLTKLASSFQVPPLPSASSVRITNRVAAVASAAVGHSVDLSADGMATDVDPPTFLSQLDVN